VLVHLVLLKGLALRQQKRDDAVGVVIGAKDLGMVSRNVKTI
jgi:hypothetical protein